MRIAHLFYKPMSFEWAMVMIVVMLIGTLLLVAAGAYVFLRVFASVYNSKQSAWDSAASKLGLKVDSSKQRLHKDFIGKRDGFELRVSHYGVPRGESSSDPHASVEIRFMQSPGFSFEIKKLDMGYQRVADFFDDSQETGIDYFDKAFAVKCSHMSTLIALLTTDIPNAESTNLINDLMRINKKCFRVRFTDEVLVLGSYADIGDSSAIESIIKTTVYFAKRVELAVSKL